MATEVAYAQHAHGGPGPCWTGPRETPTPSEARTMLTHWFADRAATAAPDAASYKASIQAEKTDIMAWLSANPEFHAVLRQVKLLEAMGLSPVVEIVTDDGDDIQVRIKLA